MLENHMENKHTVTDTMHESMHSCERCEETYQLRFILDSHDCLPVPYKYQCDHTECEFIGTSVENIIGHIIEVHRRPGLKCDCDCEFQTNENSELYKHVTIAHRDINSLIQLQNQQTFLCESFKLFGQDMHHLITKLVDGQNIMRTEIMFLKEALDENNNPNAFTSKSNKEGYQKEVPSYASKAASNATIKEKPKKPEQFDEGPKPNLEETEATSQSVIWFGDSHTNN